MKIKISISILLILLFVSACFGFETTDSGGTPENYTVHALGNQSGSLEIDLADGVVQSINMTGDLELTFTGWPDSGEEGTCRLYIHGNGYTLTVDNLDFELAEIGWSAIQVNTIDGGTTLIGGFPNLVDPNGWSVFTNGYIQAQLDAVLIDNSISVSTSLDAILAATWTRTTSLDAILADSINVSTSLDSVLVATTNTTTTSLDAVVTSAGAQDKCVGGTAYAYWVSGSNVAANAFDDNVATFWETPFDFNMTNKEIRYDFGSGVTWSINKVNVVVAEIPDNPTYCTSTSVKIEYSTDGTTKILLKDWTALPETTCNIVNTLTYTNATAFRYLHVTFNSTAISIRIKEIEAFVD